MTKEPSASRKYLTNYSRANQGIVAWRLSGITWRREGGGVCSIFMYGDGDTAGCIEPAADISVVLFGDQARELLGFNSLIPEE